MTPSFSELHAFRDSKLLRRALTHASAGGDHNERLEWLGDSLLDFLAGCFLFERYPRVSEGVLTQARAAMVNGKTLAALAREIGLDKRINLSSGARFAGGLDSALAGAFEAYFAAVYLDGGMEAVRLAASRVFAETLKTVDRAVLEGGGALKDGKTRLQEYLQGRGEPAPEYHVLGRGEISARRVYCAAECRLDSRRRTAAVAGNRREAETAAAECMLALLSG